ncbi:MAG: hypothetical protein EXX96DRAFT_40592 [Benjaminiella poitrasii]|nr:MAG: hypothetical protein EXX96DRAFT_40592 [Benjaminiella poitrasii]
MAKCIFITGATTGLGRLAAKKCIDKGYKVIITGRTEQKIKDAQAWILKDSPQSKDKLYGLELDLLNLDTVQKAVQQLDGLGISSIDVLIHNAGGTQTEFKAVGQVESTIFMNAIAPLYLTQLLLPYIERSEDPQKRILFVASSLHDPETRGGGRSEATLIPQDIDLRRDVIVSDEMQWDSMKYYKISKLAVVWDTFALASRYPTTIPIIAFCPGFVPTTELIRHSGFILQFVLKYAISRFSFATTEEDATDDYLYYVTAPDIKTGTYYQRRQPSTSSKDSLNETKREAYFELANNAIRDITSIN